MPINLSSDPGEVGDLSDLIFGSIYISGDNRVLEFVRKDSMSFDIVWVNEESSCSGVEEDLGIDDFIFFLRLARNRKGNGE